MSPHPTRNDPWPVQTPHPPAPTPRSIRKRQPNDLLEPARRSSKMSRQIVADAPAVASAKSECEWLSGNDIISCFPTADTVIPQHEWATFVWNSRRPQITQFNVVDIYLFHGDSQEQILKLTSVPNPTILAGSVTAQVNDLWWGTRGTNWQGQNISYPYYWVLQPGGQALDGSEQPQATFRAVQTTYADSVASSMASTSSAAAASQSLASVSASSKASSGSGGAVQSDASGSAFPHWAIAVIVLLGFFAILAFTILAFLVCRRMRRENSLSNRGSMGSASPMMANIQSGHSPQSPLLGGAAGLAMSSGKPPSSHGHRAPSLVSPDGASTISHADSGPFSGADAAIMADAFRKALRKPEFAAAVEEGESPDTMGTQERKEELMNRELAQEGRDIRSVGSLKGYRVETSDEGGPAQESPR